MKQEIAQRCGSVKLLPGTPFYDHSQVDTDYLLSLKEKYLLQNYHNEAGILGEEDTDIPYMFGLWDDKDFFKGWEHPTSQLRGHFLGHWLSAACWMYTMTGDTRLKGKVDYIVAELGRCQERNGGKWVAAIPEKYLQWVVEGKSVWAPHYNIHKTFMGLIDAARLTNNQQALQIACRFAEWFEDWSAQFDEEKMQDILETETGGMMEAFADLYALTGDPRHLRLMQIYEHKRLFDRMMNGEDILTNKHANTTIPEIHGVCRAYELTGDPHYLNVMLAYWKLAVEDRGAFVTGGQSLGEIWTPEDSLDARIGNKNQEHCTVYNMIRLADYLYRALGDVKYQDYIEENLYNGVLAQCFYKGYGDDYGHHSAFSTGYRSTVVTYFLPLAPGSRKNWVSETDHFFCCHGSAVQACATFQNYIFYKTNNGFIINQYISASFQNDGKSLMMEKDPLTEFSHRPDFWRFRIKADGGEYSISLRVPCWSKGVSLTVDGEKVEAKPQNGYITLIRNWAGQEIVVDFKLAIAAIQLKDSPRFAFREGPIALAGIIDREVSLNGSPDHLEAIIRPYAEREWDFWRNRFTTAGQSENFVLKYLYEIYDEQYTVYFPFS